MSLGFEKQYPVYLAFHDVVVVFIAPSHKDGDGIIAYMRIDRRSEHTLVVTTVL